MLWAIHAEDKPGSMSLRQATRASHLDYVSAFPIRIGGPLLDDSGEMCGSLILVDLPDRAAVDDFVAADPYNQAGLFERVSVHLWRQTVGAPPTSVDATA